MTRAERWARPVGVVEWPRYWSGFDTTHLLMNKIFRECGLKVRGQVTAKVESDGRVRRCVLDLTVFDDSRRCIAIIEVKRSSRAKTETRQIRRYRAFNLPVLICRGPSDIQPTIQAIQELKRNGEIRVGG